MKFIAQLFIVILFVLFYVVGLLVGTTRFKLLDYNLWTSKFEEQSVYSELATVIKTSLDAQVDKEGGSKSDISILTDLITEENTKDFVDNNSRNIIDYLNGKSGELFVYVPISRAPQGLLPKNISSLNNEMTVSQLSQKFNVVGLEMVPLENLKNTGKFVTYIFIASLVLVILLTILLVLIVENGNRFVALGISLILSGLSTLGLAQGGAYLLSHINQNFKVGEMVEMIIATTFPPVLSDIVVTWTYLGVGVVALGVLVFLIKKPGLR